MSFPDGRLYINGVWCTSDTTFTSRATFDRTALAEVYQATPAQVDEAIDAAQKAYEIWSKTSVYQRAEVLRLIAARIREHRDELANIMMLEAGKPYQDAYAEADASATNFEWFASAITLQNDALVPAHDDRLQFVRHVPIGVVGIISPWNFPLNLIIRKLAPALAAGNAVVIKPSSETPLVAAALLAAIDLSTLPVPKGLINLIHGHLAMISERFMASDVMRKLSFTGSTAVGQQLYEQSAKTLKRISLELGGNAPFIVTEHADLAKAAQDLVLTKTRNNGQVCTCPNRVLVADAVYDAFVAQVIAACRKVHFGDPKDQHARYGPLINEGAVEKIQALVDDALAQGAKITYQEEIERTKNRFPLTVLTKVSDQMRIYREEIFGPVIAMIPFTDVTDAIRQANNTEFGLAAYLYTEDRQEMRSISDAIESGLVGVNNTLVSTAETPFGGVKHSGIGRENGHYGLREFQTIKLITLRP